MKKITIDYDQGIDRITPIVDFLIINGNEFVSIESNKLGTLCLFLKNPIDAILIKENFELPQSIVVDETPHHGVIIRDIKNSFNIQQFMGILCNKN